MIAENIERIYKQNCQNLGVLTSTDFSADRQNPARQKKSRSPSSPQAKTKSLAQVIEYGGLFPFNVARLQKKVFLPPIKTANRPMTLAEKIFARHMLDSKRTEVRRRRPAGGAKFR